MSSELASLISRSSVLIDHIIASIGGMVLGLPLGFVVQDGIAFNTVTWLVAGATVVLLNLLYFIYFEGKNGDTPMKAFLGVEVMRKDGRPISYKQSLVRNLLRLVDVSTFYLTGTGFILASSTGQRLGDLAAGTIVVAQEEKGEKFRLESVEHNIGLMMQVLGYSLAVLGMLPTIGWVVAQLIAAG